MLVDTHAKPPKFSSLFTLADVLPWPQQSFQHRQLTCPSSAFDPTWQTHSFYSNKTLEVFKWFLLPRVDFKTNMCMCRHTRSVGLCSGPGRDQTWAANNITHIRVQVTRRSEGHLKDSHLSRSTQIYRLKGEVRHDGSNPHRPNDPILATYDLCKYKIIYPLLPINPGTFGHMFSLSIAVRSSFWRTWKAEAVGMDESLMEEEKSSIATGGKGRRDLTRWSFFYLMYI